MKPFEVIMVGTPCLDEYYELDTPFAMGDKSCGRFLGNQLGGMISNAATIIASYGLRTALIDTLNMSSASIKIIEGLKDAGVSSDLISHDDSLPDGKCMVFLHKGERGIVILSGGKRNLTMTEVQKEAILNAKVLYTTLSAINEYEEGLQIVRKARKRGVKIALDIERSTILKNSTDIEYLMESSILFINEGGFLVLSELYGENLFDSLVMKDVIVVKTLGAKGCAVRAKKIPEFTTPALDVIPVDTTGAGDTFNSTFVYGLLAGWSLEKCAFISNGAAGRSVTLMGAQSGACGLEKVIDFIKKYSQGGLV